MHIIKRSVRMEGRGQCKGNEASIIEFGRGDNMSNKMKSND